MPAILSLKQKLRAAEAERDTLKARPAPQAAPEPRQQVQQPIQAQQPPAQRPQAPQTRPEPTENEIGTKYPTYAAFTRDQAVWVHEQERARDRVEAAQEAAQRERQTWASAHIAREAEFRKTTPDYDAVVTAADAAFMQEQIIVPDVMKEAILSSEKSDQLVYWLASHLPEYRQLVQEAWQVNQKSSVAMVRRVLESQLPSVAPQQRTSREQAAPTGSAAPLPRAQAPRPPNPVRTGQQAPGDTPPTDDDDTIDRHVAVNAKRWRGGRLRN